MASGNSLLYFGAASRCGPATAAAQYDFVVGTSSPVENIPVLAFDTTTVEYADFRGKMPQNYAGGGVTLSFCTGCGTATGGVVMAAAFRAFEDDTEDLDTTAHTYDYNTMTIGTLASAVGEVTYDTMTFTDGADMDSVGAGDEFILRVRRDTGNGSDTAAADLFLHGIEIRET